MDKTKHANNIALASDAAAAAPAIRLPEAPATVSTPTPTSSGGTNRLIVPSGGPTGRKPRNYPTVAKWIESLEEDMEQGRDRYDYRVLLPIFQENQKKRLDDIDFLGYDQLNQLVKEAGLPASPGLLGHIARYAHEDVIQIRQ